MLMKEMIQLRQGAMQQPTRAPRQPEMHTGWGEMGAARLGSTTVARSD